MLSGYIFFVYNSYSWCNAAWREHNSIVFPPIPHPYLWWRWPRFLCARRRLFPLENHFGNQFQPLLSSESHLFKQKNTVENLGKTWWKLLKWWVGKSQKKHHCKSMKNPCFSGNKFGGWESCIPDIATPESCHLEVIGNLGCEQLVCVTLPENQPFFSLWNHDAWKMTIFLAEGRFFWLLFCCWFWFFSGLFAVCSFCRVFEADLGGCMGQNQFSEWGVNSHLLFVSERVSMVEANNRGHYITKPNNALGWWFGILGVPPK